MSEVSRMANKSVEIELRLDPNYEEPSAFSRRDIHA